LDHPNDSHNPKVSLGAEGRYIYKAAGNTTQQAHMGDAPDVLVVSGGFVDTIDQVSPGMIMPRTAGMFLPTAINIILNDIDRIFDGLSCPTGESLSEVKWRTPIANSTMGTHQEAPSSYGNMYMVGRERVKGEFMIMDDSDMNALAPWEYFGRPSALPQITKFAELVGDM
jgi:hypothetical protein